MKKKMVLFIGLLIMGSFSFADEIVIYAGEAKVYNSILSGFTDQIFAIKYDTEKEQYYFLNRDFMTTSWIYLEKTDIQLIIKALEKFLEWEKKAVENEVKLDKAIPGSIISTRKVLWESGDEWYQSKQMVFQFSFFSQDTIRHQLVINFGKVEASSNKYIDLKLDQLYFDLDQVKVFLEGISTEAIAKCLEEHKKQKVQEEMFQ